MPSPREQLPKHTWWSKDEHYYAVNLGRKGRRYIKRLTSKWRRRTGVYRRGYSGYAD